MKRKLITALVLILVLSAFACNKDDVKNPENTPISNTTDAPTAESKTQQPEATAAHNNGVLDAYTKVLLHEIYIDVPSSYVSYEESFTRIFRDQYIKYLAVYSNPLDKQDTIETAYESILDEFFIETQNINSPLQRFDKELEERVNINGIDAYHYTGKIICKGSFDESTHFISGYAFVMDGVPINIAGVTIENSDDEALNKEIVELVDAMMKSVRTQP